MVLVNASGVGRINPSTANAVITVAANDYPYGLFSFSTAFRPLSVTESVGEVTLVVSREFGSTGTVTVDYMTVSSQTLPLSDK